MDAINPCMDTPVMVNEYPRVEKPCSACGPIVCWLLWADPGSNYRITNFPSTIGPSGYQKETQCTKCTAQSHPRWLQWVAAGLRCLQPWDGMCFSLRGIRSTQQLALEYPFIMLTLAGS
jgi:hypothetical protein